MIEFLENNLRVIISVFIVIIVALGIYSYANEEEATYIKENRECIDEYSETPQKDIPAKCLKCFY